MSLYILIPFFYHRAKLKIWLGGTGEADDSQ